MIDRGIRVVKRFFILLTIMNVILMIYNNKCQANTNLDVELNYIEAEDMMLPFGAEKAIAGIIRLLRDTSIIISVVVLTIIGLKFMLGSVEEKARYKETLGPWVLGVLIIGLSCSTLPTLIYNMVSEENGIEINAAQVQVTLNHSEVTLSLGENEEVSLIATVLSNEEIDNTVTWTSSNSSIATVDSAGKVKAQEIGTTIIKATAGGAEASCKVTVESSRTMDLTISESSITLNSPIELTHTLSATITPPTSREPLYWTTSDSSVATVRNGVVRATGAGTAVITAKSGSKSATCTVQVNSMHMFAGQFYNPITNTVSSSRKSNKDLEFLLYIPEASAVKNVDKLSLVVYLHGGQLQSVYGLKNHNNPFNLKNEEVKYGAVFIFPISPYEEGKYGWMEETDEMYGTLKSLMDYSTENYNVDKNKIALTGFSNGGGGVWKLGIKYPRQFSCLVPVSGYRCEEAAEYPDCPVWAICSSGDSSDGYAERLCALITNANGKAKYDNLGAIPHSEMQKKAYTPDVINWMIERSRETNSRFEF